MKLKSCRQCHRHFVAKRKTQTFCSRRCASVYGVQHAKTSDTDIERILEGLLIALDIKYNKQYAIPDCRTVPDFFVAPNIAIYADGVYWHNKPRAKRRDSRINSMLEKRGYRTLRFPGDVLKNNPDSVKEILAQEVIDAD